MAAAPPLCLSLTLTLTFFPPNLVHPPCARTPPSYTHLNKLLSVDFACSTGSHLLESGTDLIIVAAVTTILASLLDLGFIKIAITIQVQLASK